MISVDNLLERSFFITVNDGIYARRDADFRRRFELERLNTPLPRRFEGFQIKNGVYRQAGLIKTNDMCSCFLSHMAVVKAAQALDWPFVCVFENDAVPRKNCREKLEAYLAGLPPETGLLKLGHLGSLDGNIKRRGGFVEIKTYGAHAYVVFRRYYREYMRLARQDLHIDRLAMNEPGDGSLVLATEEMLFAQDPGPGISNNAKYQKLLLDQGFLDGFSFG